MKKYLLFSTILLVTFFAACKKNEVDNLPVADFIIKNQNAEVNEGAVLKLVNNSLSSKNLSYAWDFGNGVTSTEREPSVTYGIHGIYNIQLTITDDKGRVSSVTKEVTVLCIYATFQHAPLF